MRCDDGGKSDRRGWWWWFHGGEPGGGDGAEGSGDGVLEKFLMVVLGAVEI